MSKHLTVSLLAAMLTLASCSSDNDVPETRERLLSATPIGSDGTNVLKYVVDDLKPKGGIGAYVKYVNALQAGRQSRLDVQRLDFGPPAVPKPSDWPTNEDYPPREIFAFLKTYLNGNRLLATWTFDKNDKLLTIDVVRDMTP